MFRTLFGFAAAAAALCSHAAQACSVTADYVAPSNFELVQIADAIVVATPQRRSVSWNDDDGPSVRFRVQQALKGETPRDLTLPGTTIGQVELGDANRLIGAHPDAHAGMCIRQTFRRGQPVLLFLARDAQGQWRQLGFPFARVNEDYFGPDALWPRTVRQYLAIQSEYEPMQELAALERLLEGELANPQTEEERERARDILSHLMSRSEWKPTQYLIESYEGLERGETPRYAFRSRAADQEQSAAQALASLVFADRAVPAISTNDQMWFVLNALISGDHPEAAPLFERILANEPNPWQLGMAIRFIAKHGDYPTAYGLIETQALDALSTASDEDARHLIRAIQRTQLGEQWIPGAEPWRAHPEIAARWPALAQRLWDFQVTRFGERQAYPFPDVDIR
ncbi:MAG TPA: hypothetical protein VEA80_17360 [Vitreimonas sp.]|uniref:hypothetical protein n=1 Tax=Vitreimonas sp. TaxID=3069702 RepID=UPI002D552702|nr:hypothetical protein [Vitreimonas sp.]HYD89250.1 hypothetical protein [Vitreimonas sp.]